jgi:hypothetical protein
MYGSNGAYACETSSRLHQEISKTSVTLKYLNLAPRRQAGRAAQASDQYTLQRK